MIERLKELEKKATKERVRRRLAAAEEVVAAWKAFEAVVEHPRCYGNFYFEKWDRMNKAITRYEEWE